MIKEKNKTLLLIFIPFLWGYIINILVWKVSIIGDLYFRLNIVWETIFILFWFWTGTKFAQYNSNKVKAYIIGNSIWLLSFLVYIWQFILLSGESRSFRLAGLSQHYIAGIVFISKKIIRLFTNTISSETVIILSYSLMITIFTTGFIYRIKNKNN